MRATLAVWSVAAALIVGYLAGVWIGGRHPGQVLVPARAGVPGDLPGWACDELVQNRLDDYVDSVRPRRREHEFPFVLHYPALDVCRGGGADEERGW